MKLYCNSYYICVFLAEKACHANNESACHNLAFMYKRGDGTSKNEKLAEEYWQVMENHVFVFGKLIVRQKSKYS